MVKSWIAFGMVMVLAACGGNSTTTELEKGETSSAGSESAKPEESTGGAASSSAATGEIAVTNVRKEDGKYSAMINGAIVFRELEINKDDEGKDRLFFPKTPGREGKEFSTVYLKDRNIAHAIKDAIREGKATGKGAPEALKITAIQWHGSTREGKLKGFADVMFNDAIEIKGLKLLDGKDGLWVAWPSVKRGEKYVDLIFAPNEGVRKMVEAAIKKEAGL